MADDEQEGSLADRIRRRLEDEKDTPGEKADELLLAGRYKLLEQIDEDQTTITLKAGHAFARTYLRIKLMKPEYRDDKAAVHALQEEAKESVRTGKSGGGEIQDFGLSSDGRPYLVFGWDFRNKTIYHSKPLSAEDERMLVGEPGVMSAAMAAIAANSISKEEQAELDRLGKMAMESAREFVKNMSGRRADADVKANALRAALGRALAELERNGLRSCWRDCIFIIKHLVVVPPDNLDNYLNSMLEALAARFGEESVRQYLLERFRQWAERFDLPNSHGQVKQIYSNKQLALSFMERLYFDRPDVYISAEEKAEKMRGFADEIDERPLNTVG